jgi:galactokinase
MNLANTVRAKYQKQYHEKPLLLRSPGRVNIIGEHTDYNEGFVLPAAIERAVYMAMGKREDQAIHLHAEAFQRCFIGNLQRIERSEWQWANYLLGVVIQLQQRGHSLGGFNLILDGDIPMGAGLSSSAAIACGTVFGLRQLFQLNLSKTDMARIAQLAEQNFAGVQCGIMDQFANLFGKKDHVIKLDCRSLQHEYAPLQLEGYELVLLNTNIEHQLADSAFNTRRQECEQGVRWIQQQHPAVRSLRDATMPMLEQCVKPKDKVIFRRCAFVLQENERLLGAYEDLQQGRLAALGEKMFRTHEGLSGMYEVSCPELDFLVEAVRAYPAVLGARMMGGGFGGCTINLVSKEMVPRLIEEVSSAYRQAMGLALSAYVVQPADGTALLP